MVTIDSLEALVLACDLALALALIAMAFGAGFSVLVGLILTEEDGEA
jgi:hypothetical protein